MEVEYVIGSSRIQSHVWTVGLRAKPVRLLNSTLIFFPIRTELPVIKCKKSRSVLMDMFPKKAKDSLLGFVDTKWFFDIFNDLSRGGIKDHVQLV